jgi:hypothetical protein
LHEFLREVQLVVVRGGDCFFYKSLGVALRAPTLFRRWHDNAPAMRPHVVVAS